MRRLSLLLLPFLAAFALLFGVYYLYLAFRLIQSGRGGVGVGLVTLFGLMGVGLAIAIWVARKRVGRTRGASNASSGQPPA
jgi:hypothetical protein